MVCQLQWRPHISDNTAQGGADHMISRKPSLMAPNNFTPRGEKNGLVIGDLCRPALIYQVNET